MRRSTSQAPAARTRARSAGETDGGADLSGAEVVPRLRRATRSAYGVFAGKWLKTREMKAGPLRLGTFLRHQDCNGSPGVGRRAQVLLPEGLAMLIDLDSVYDPQVLEAKAVSVGVLGYRLDDEKALARYDEGSNPMTYAGTA